MGPPTPCEPSSIRAGFESDAANAGLRGHSVRYYVTNETGAGSLINAISTGAAAPVSAADVERLVSIPNFKHAQAVGHHKRKGNDANGRPRRVGSLIGMFEKK